MARKKYKWIFTCEQCKREHAYDKKWHAETHATVHAQAKGHYVNVEKKEHTP